MIRSLFPPRSFPLLSLLLLVSLGAEAWSQSTTGRRRVSLTQTVEPSFRIEPVVHRFTGRRGEVIPFEFLIGSMGKEMNVSVTPVNLRQEETGIILHDGQSEPSLALRITSPRTFTLSGGEQTTIRGELKVPLARTNYLSYGILVREAGTAPDFEKTEETKTRAGIRFVTQYVLRVDVETGIADAGALGELRLERGALVAEHGMPLVRGYINNPTDYAFECFVSASMDGDVRRARPIRLGMPSRATLDDDERYLVRIMPRSTLRLEAPFDRLISPGERTLRLSLGSGRREVSSAEFALQLREEDFPALATKRAVLGGVAMTPAQIEIGSIRSAKRTVGMKFQNTNDAATHVEIEPRSLDGRPLANVRFAPASFTLKPGRSKGVRATLRGRGLDAVEAAVAVVRWTRDGDQPVERQVPLSVLGAEPGPPNLEVENVAWDGDAFVTEVVNRSNAYTPVAATLAVGANGAVRMRLEDGYGRWLAPGESAALTFRPDEPIAAGDYALILEVRTREGFPPIVRELNVVLEGATVTAAADNPKPTQG